MHPQDPTINPKLRIRKMPKKGGLIAVSPSVPGVYVWGRHCFCSGALETLTTCDDEYDDQSKMSKTGAYMMIKVTMIKVNHNL